MLSFDDVKSMGSGCPEPTSPESFKKVATNEAGALHQEQEQQLQIKDKVETTATDDKHAGEVLTDEHKEEKDESRTHDEFREEEEKEEDQPLISVGSRRRHRRAKRCKRKGRTTKATRSATAEEVLDLGNRPPVLLLYLQQLQLSPRSQNV